MGRLTVVGLTVIAVLLVAVTAVVLGKDWISDALHPRREAPRIMILTSQVLEHAAEINRRQGEAAEELAKIIATGTPAQNAKAGAQPAAASPAKTAPAGAEQGRDLSQLPSLTQADGLSLAVRAIQESLDGKVSQDIDNSRRFTLVPSARVTDALLDFARDQKRPPQSLLQFVTGGVASRQTFDGKGPEGKVDQTITNSETSSVLSQGITAVARKVKADYTLIVTIGEPRFVWDVLPASNGMPVRIHMVAQPEVNCEIFDSKTQRAYRFANQLAKPISETVIVDPTLPLRGQVLTKLTRLDDRISDAASKQILALVLDKVAPARIVQAGGRLVINRGSNDGVRDGAVFDVKREVDETIREEGTGADLGRSQVAVGQLVVQSVETAKSTVAVASGGPFLKGDIVVMALPVSPTDRRAAASPSGQAAPGAMPNLAVDYIRLNQADSPALGVTVSTALAAEPRIAVLPRAEMAKLRSEAAHNSMASGEFGMTAEEGMRQSGYLVSGECSTSSRRHNNVISVGGVSETVSSSVSSSASCTLRALAVDGRLIGSGQGSGGSTDAAASAAARALLSRILPVLGVTPSAPEPEPAGEPAAQAAPAPRPARAAASRPKARPAAEEPAVRF